MNGRKLARMLGWFSIGLGLVEAAAPNRLGKYLGLEKRSGLMRVCGSRELATGAGILARPGDSRWLWARVGGDALDLAGLSWAMTERSAKRGSLGIAVGAVAVVTALDVFCAMQLDR